MRKTNYGPSGAILDNTTGITDIQDIVVDTSSGDPTVHIVTMALLVFAIVFAIIGLFMRSVGIAKVHLGVFALSLLCLLGSLSLFIFSNYKIQAREDAVEKLHRDILVDNQFDMDSYELEEIADFKNNGKLLRWKDVDGEETAFATRHNDSSDINRIKIAIVGKDDIKIIK